MTFLEEKLNSKIRWAKKYPELGTEPLPVEPCISEEYFKLEQERVFREVWLCVGRIEELPQPGSYLVKDLAVARTSILLIHGKDGAIQGFHNVCSHRGNKLAWNKQGSCRAFKCKFHTWVYDTKGQLVNVPDEELFFDFDRRKHGLTPVSTEIWEGFIFVNLNSTPSETLKEYLGEMVERNHGFPFARHTASYGYRVVLNCNWKIILDAFTEEYHVPFLHGRWGGGALTSSNNPLCHLLYVELYQRHRVSGVNGNPDHKPFPVMSIAHRFGTTFLKRGADVSVENLPPGVNPDRRQDFSFEKQAIFPNFLIHLVDGTYFTHQFWPLNVNQTLWEGKTYYTPPRNAAERFSQEYAHLLMRENWLEDTSTMESTHAMLASGAKTHFILQDNEILLRHSHKVLEDYVGFYKK